MLQVAHLTKHYGQLAALSDVSFSIRPAEVLGLIGPNGSGKTTLFECLGGVLPSDAGAVLAEGRPLTPAEQRSTVFYLPDAIAPWPSQTVRWALDFVRGYWGRTGVGHGCDPGRGGVAHASDADPTGVAPVSDPCATPVNVLQRLDLESLLDTRIGELSKGQRKRALLAFGLLTPQPVLLADEPFEGLDLRQTRDVAQTLRQYAADGRTLVLSIHQISDAARVCDRFVLLSGGRVRGEGTLDDLTRLAGLRHASNARTHDAGSRKRSESAGDQGSAPDNLEDIFLALT